MPDRPYLTVPPDRPHYAAERRPAIWPWFVMPAAALALFVTLHTVRQTTTSGHSNARGPAQSAASLPQ